MQSNEATESMSDKQRSKPGDSIQLLNDKGYVSLQNTIEDHMLDEKHEMHLVQLKNEGVRFYELILAYSSSTIHKNYFRSVLEMASLD